MCPLAGGTGFEPVHDGVKVRCLTNLANPQQLNNRMPSKYSRELVESILASTDKKFKSTHEMILWQRGYLTGLLASIADNDFYAQHLLEQRLKELRGANLRDRT